MEKRKKERKRNKKEMEKRKIHFKKGRLKYII
jgi:hypothetical protein